MIGAMGGDRGLWEVIGVMGGDRGLWRTTIKKCGDPLQRSPHIDYND